MKRLGFYNFIDTLRRLWHSSTRQLSMVFFVGRGRAHTFRIPLVLVYGMLAVLAATTVWSVVSTAFLIFLSNQNDWLESQLDMTRGIVLKYQAQYERLFERSYPQMAQHEADRGLNLAEKELGTEEAAKRFDDKLKQELKGLKTEENLADVPADADAPEWADMPSSAPSQESAAAPAISAESSAATANAGEATASQTASTPASVAPTPAAMPEESATASSAGNAEPSIIGTAEAGKDTVKSELLRPSDLTIRDLRIAGSDSGLDVRFNLQNSGRIPKAQGYLTVVGRFVSADGKQTFQVVPKISSFDPTTGFVGDFTQGESFSAARFRPSQFRLTKPAGMDGRFSAVRIVLTDREGKIADELTKDIPPSDVAGSPSAPVGG